MKRRGFIADYYFNGPGRAELDQEIQRIQKGSPALTFRQALDAAVTNLRADEEPAQKNER